MKGKSKLKDSIHFEVMNRMNEMDGMLEYFKQNGIYVW